MADPVPAYSFTSPRPQLFAFPTSFVRSMLDNPSSPKGLLKLYQTCKYFYGKRPILIADYMEIEKNQESGETTAKFTQSRNGSNVMNLRTPIWLTKSIDVIDSVPIAQLPKLFRSSVYHISVYCNELPYEYFALLTFEKMVNYCYVSHVCHVYHADKSNATIDQILKCLPNILYFNYFIDEKCSLEVLQKLYELSLKNRLQYIQLLFLDIHQTFDINLFCEFVMKNSNVDTMIRLYLHGESKEKLKLALDKLDPKWKKAHPGLEEFFEKIVA